MIEERFQSYMKTNSPSDGYFFNGVAYTREIVADLTFGHNRYYFVLIPTAVGGIFIDKEATQYIPQGSLGTIASGVIRILLNNCV
jgi:hypothetical protein